MNDLKISFESCMSLQIYSILMGACFHFWKPKWLETMLEPSWNIAWVFWNGRISLHALLKNKDSKQSHSDLSTVMKFSCSYLGISVAIFFWRYYITAVYSTNSSCDSHVWNSKQVARVNKWSRGKMFSVLWFWLSVKVSCAPKVF